MNETATRRDEILQKIQNLLELSKGTNFQNESEVAYLKAEQLMAEYNIKRTEIRDKQEIGVVRIPFPTTSFSKWVKDLYVMITEPNGVKLYWKNASMWGPASISLVGRYEDVDTVRYYYNFLSIQISKMTDRWYKEFKIVLDLTARHKNDYRNGLIFGLGRIFNDLNNRSYKKQEEWGLVPVDESAIRFKQAQELYEKNKKIRTVSSSTRNSIATQAGYADADKLSINKGVNNDNKVLQIA